jgi:hypothetical protein
MRIVLQAGLAAGIALTFPGVSTLMFSTAAMASSIETVTAPPAATPNITRLSCAAVCPPQKSNLSASTYVVPDIAPGTERTELREINGKMKFVRAEAWLGGSPVTFVSTASDAAVRLARGEPAVPATGPAFSVAATSSAGRPTVASASTSMNVSIDQTMTTAALSSATPSSAIRPIAASVATSQDFDGQNFKLRLD